MSAVLADPLKGPRSRMEDTIELPDAAAPVRDYGQPTTRPVTHLIISTKLDWTRPPGLGVTVLRFGPVPY